MNSLRFLTWSMSTVEGYLWSVISTQLEWINMPTPPQYTKARVSHKTSLHIAVNQLSICRNIGGCVMSQVATSAGCMGIGQVEYHCRT